MILYLIRHGQAGLRGCYDNLSDLGRLQSRLLGAHLAAEGLRFRAVYSGSLKRQTETAAEVYEAYREAGGQLPGLIVDPGWNEFDMAGVFDGFAPRLREADPDFRVQHEALMAALAAGDPAVQREWTPCDTATLRAWIEARFPFDGESWREFRERVLGCRERLNGHGSRECVAVFTSAVPISLWLGAALELSVPNQFKLAGAMYNSAVSSVGIGSSGLSVFGYNSVAHLTGAAMRTLR